MPRWGVLLLLLGVVTVRADPEPTEQRNAFWFSPGWIAGELDRFEPEGIDLFFDYWADFLANPAGGQAQRADYAHEIYFGAEFDLAKLVHWNGGKLTVSMAHGAGRDLSTTIGNFFTPAQAFVGQGFVLYELNLEQKLFDERLELTFGRVNAGNFFASLPAFGELVTGGLNGNPATLYENIPFTGSPRAVWGAVTKIDFSETVGFQNGIFQANDRVNDPAYYGFDFSIRPQDGFLFMSELSLKTAFGKQTGTVCGKGRGKSVKEPPPADFPGLEGLYLLGGYWSNFHFDRFQGGSETNAFGFYAMGQQMLWRSRANPDRSFALWGGATLSPQAAIAQVPFMGFAGFAWNGPLPARPEDQLYLAFMVGTFSPDYAGAQSRSGQGDPTFEMAFDLSYVIQLTEQLGIQPDMQLILRPGGRGEIPPAYILGLQVVANF